MQDTNERSEKEVRGATPSWHINIVAEKKNSFCMQLLVIEHVRARQRLTSPLWAYCWPVVRGKNLYYDKGEILTSIWWQRSSWCEFRVVITELNNMLHTALIFCYNVFTPLLPRLNMKVKVTCDLLHIVRSIAEDLMELNKSHITFSSVIFTAGSLCVCKALMSVAFLSCVCLSPPGVDIHLSQLHWFHVYSKITGTQTATSV